MLVKRRFKKLRCICRRLPNLAVFSALNGVVLVLLMLSCSLVSADTTGCRYRGGLLGVISLSLKL